LSSVHRASISGLVDRSVLGFYSVNLACAPILLRVTSLMHKVITVRHHVDE